MDRSDWGVKRLCLKCNARFYDFNKSPIECPVCGTIFDPESSLKRKSKNSVKNDELEDARLEDLEDALVDEDNDDDDMNDDVDDDVDDDINIDDAKI